jgi:hypothetical protein
MLRRQGSGWVSVGLILVALCSQSQAAIKTYTFENITNNNATNAQTGEDQLSVTVFGASASVGETSPFLFEDYGITLEADQVGFLFQNTGPLASAITDVYFDDGTLLGISSIYQSDGVSFSQGAKPDDLPGGEAIGFVTTAGFLADSDSPIKHNGVQPGEYLIIVFDMINGQDYDGTIEALALGRVQPEGQTGSLRIGIHVQGFANGGSESFVNNPPDSGVVPEPATMLVWSGLGLIGALAAYRAKRKKPL